MVRVSGLLEEPIQEVIGLETVACFLAWVEWVPSKVESKITGLKLVLSKNPRPTTLMKESEWVSAVRLRVQVSSDMVHGCVRMSVKKLVSSSILDVSSIGLMEGGVRFGS